jgi:hypothetical protein
MVLGNARRAAQIGAIFYILWGILHLVVGVTLLADLLSDGLPRDTASARAVMYFWCVIILGAVATFVGARLNWRNDATGYWINLGVSTAGDLGLIVFMLWPGNLSLANGISGPAFWLPAVVFSTIARFAAAPARNRIADATVGDTRGYRH